MFSPFLSSCKYYISIKNKYIITIIVIIINTGKKTRRFHQLNCDQRLNILYFKITFHVMWSNKFHHIYVMFSKVQHDVLYPMYSKVQHDVLYPMFSKVQHDVLYSMISKVQHDVYSTQCSLKSNTMYSTQCSLKFNMMYSKV